MKKHDIDIHAKNNCCEAKEIAKTRNDRLMELIYISVIISILYYLVQKIAPMKNSINPILDVFLGILLQAIPFLIIGVIVASIIQVFVSREFIEKKFQNSKISGYIFAIVGGFIFPVCDCASVPVFKSLLKKSVPLSVAMTFMLSTPVINPVVIFSTYFAFNGNLKVVFSRVILGIISAVLISLIFSALSKNSIKKDILNLDEDNHDEDDQNHECACSNICACGHDHSESANKGFSGKLIEVMLHSKNEFLNIGAYLVVASFVSAIFQQFSIGIDFSKDIKSTIIGTIIMMILSFVLSLCSSSDAFIGRSLINNFSINSVMGFLVFGPMMDIKNVILLSSVMTKKSIVKLVLISFIVCLLVVSIYMGLVF